MPLGRKPKGNNMQTHDLVQGTLEWHTYRRNHFNASDAPAMLGASPYKSRDELLHELSTGLTKSVDSSTQSRFDEGHRAEALARPVAEEIAGTEFYPVVGSEGRFSASFDGLNMMGDLAFEHKSLNDEIRACKTTGDLPLLYTSQMEQQLMVSGAGACLFLATKWQGDNLVEKVHFFYESNPEIRQKLIDGWAQFEKDLADYKPVEIIEMPKAEAIKALPSLSIQIRGEVVASNLPEFKAGAEQLIASIKTELVTDDDFANAKEMVKFLKDAEDNIALTKTAAIGQTASIDELMRTMDYIAEQCRQKRLTLDKLVKTEEDARKLEIVRNAATAHDAYIQHLNDEIKPIKLGIAVANFGDAIKGKKTLKSMHDAVNTMLANCKIEADAMARDYRAKLAWCKTNAEGYGFLFTDIQQIITKPMDDFQLVVKTRIDDHKRLEAEKEAKIKADAEEAARAKLAAEESEKAKQVAQTVQPAVAEVTTNTQSVDASHKLEAGDGGATPLNPAKPKQSRPTDDEIIDALTLTFRVHESKVIEWLLDMDLNEASRKLAA